MRATQETAVETLPAPPMPIPDPTTGGTSRQVPMVMGPSSTYPAGQPEWVESGAEVYSGPMDGQIIYEGGEYFPAPGEQIVGDYGVPGEFASDGGCDSMGNCGPNCESCRGRSWRPCLTICLPEDGWASFEYLGWVPRGMELPPLATTSVGTNVPANDAGVLGRGPTRVLFGGEEVFDDAFSGGRLQIGLWLDPQHKWAVVGDYFELNGETESFSGASGGNQILARPFFNILTGAEDAQLISYPGLATGSLSIDVETSFVGGGFNFRRQTNCVTGQGWSLLGDSRTPFQSRSDFLTGYRYVQLDEAITISEVLNESSAPNTRFNIEDSFRTTNQFNGWDLGVAYQRQRGHWSLELLGKMALGVTRQTVDIAGSTRINGVPGTGGGLLAQTTNIGSYSRDTFTILPELGANLGFDLTSNLRLKAGYSLIFWSNVVRPGDQIDMDINPNLFPPAIPGGAGRPEFVFRDTDFWVQGASFGGEFSW